MDNRITSIIQSVFTGRPVTYLCVGGADSSINFLRNANLDADTIFIVSGQNKKDVYFLADSKRSYALKYIVLFEETDIVGNTYGGVRFSQNQPINLKSTINTVRINLLYFDVAATTVDPFNRAGHTSQDTREAMIRSTVYLLMYLVRKNPDRDFSIDLGDGSSGRLTLRGQRSWSGNAILMGGRSYSVSFDCDDLNFTGGRPSQNDVFQMVEECFGQFAHVDDVSAYGSPGWGFSLEFKAVLR